VGRRGGVEVEEGRLEGLSTDPLTVVQLLLHNSTGPWSRWIIVDGKYRLIAPDMSPRAGGGFLCPFYDSRESLRECIDGTTSRINETI